MLWNFKFRLILSLIPLPNSFLIRMPLFLPSVQTPYIQSKFDEDVPLQSRRFRIHPYQFAIRVLATVDLRAFLFITPNLNLLTGLRFSYVLAPYREAINRSRYQYFDSPRKCGISLDAALRLGIMPCSACMRNESTPTWRLTLPPCSHSDIAYNVERVRHPISFCLFTLSIAMSGLSPELH